MRKQKEHLWIVLVFSSLVFSDFFPDHCPIYISYEPLIIHGGQVCGFWRKKKFHLNSSSATKSHGVEPSLAIFSACPLLPSSVPGAWPPKSSAAGCLAPGLPVGFAHSEAWDGAWRRKELQWWASVSPAPCQPFWWWLHSSRSQLLFVWLSHFLWFECSWASDNTLLSPCACLMFKHPYWFP